MLGHNPCPAPVPWEPIRTGIVENMSWFVCGNCGAESHPFGSGGAEKAAADMRMELLGKVGRGRA